jgi:uncharacterized phage protein (predicted DNA packaging)
MAKYTNVELLQKHLEIDFLEDGDSDYLELLLNASESRVEKEINQPLTEFVDEDDKLNPALVMVILLQAATLYANREAVAYSNLEQVPFTLRHFIQPFIKYT